MRTSDLAEDDVLAVEPWRRDGSYEELPKKIKTQKDSTCTNPQDTWLPLVFGPAFAMLNWPGLTWRNLKFSSGNLFP